MSAHSRRKGAKGELEVVAIARALGFDRAERSAPMQAGHSARHPDVDGLGVLWCEVKRYRRTPVNRFARESVAPERPGFVPTLAWRDDGQPWMATVKLEDLLKLERMAYGLAERDLRGGRDR